MFMGNYEFTHYSTEREPWRNPSRTNMQRTKTLAIDGTAVLGSSLLASTTEDDASDAEDRFDGGDGATVSVCLPPIETRRVERHSQDSAVSLRLCVYGFGRRVRGMRVATSEVATG